MSKKTELDVTVRLSDEARSLEMDLYGCYANPERFKPGGEEHQAALRRCIRAERQLSEANEKLKECDKHIDERVAAQADQEGQKQAAEIEKADAGTPAEVDPSESKTKKSKVKKVKS